MKSLLFLLAGLSGLALSGAAANPVSVQVQRTANTAQFAPFGGKNMMLVQCPQRSMTWKMLGSSSQSRLSWPGQGGVTFDYATDRITVFNRAGDLQLKQLRVTCDGNTLKLEAGAGLEIVEMP